MLEPFKEVWRPVTEEEKQKVKDGIDTVSEKFARVADSNPEVTPDMDEMEFFDPSDNQARSIATAALGQLGGGQQLAATGLEWMLPDDERGSGVAGGSADFLDDAAGNTDEQVGQTVDKTVKNVSETVNKTVESAQDAVEGFDPDSLFQEFREFMQGAGYALIAAAVLTGLALLAWLGSSASDIVGGE